MAYPNNPCLASCTVRQVTRKGNEMGISKEQYERLLMNLPSSRVANRKQGNMTLAYLEAWDVKAHLIRFFGFGGWSADVIESSLAYEDKGEKNWNVGYKVVLRLTLHGAGPSGENVTYTEAAVGSAIGARADAHDNAIKTAESDALKRCAINLGTQFGLSLYDQGSRKDVVGWTLREPDGYVRAEQPAVSDAPRPSDTMISEAQTAEDELTLKELWDACKEAGSLETPLDDAGVTLKEIIVERLRELRGES